MPSKTTSEDSLYCVIEDPEGSTERDSLELETPRPFNYGWIESTLNLIDNEPVDIMIISRGPLPAGERYPVRVLGMLRRTDGDHKVLGVLLGDSEYGHLGTVPPRFLQEIENWYSCFFELNGWANRAEALAFIQDATQPSDSDD